MIKGLSPLDDLPAVLEAADIPVQAVGGLSVDQAIQTLEMGRGDRGLRRAAGGGTEFKAADPNFEGATARHRVPGSARLSRRPRAFVRPSAHVTGARHRTIVAITGFVSPFFSHHAIFQHVN